MTEDEKGWAHIDTYVYWEKGVNNVGSYGKVDFISDRTVRRLTIQYREGTGCPGHYMDVRYYVIRVQSRILSGCAYALYDDKDGVVLFDRDSLYDFADALSIFLLCEDKVSNDIVNMAKERNGE